MFPVNATQMTTGLDSAQLNSPELPKLVRGYHRLSTVGTFSNTASILRHRTAVRVNLLLTQPWLGAFFASAKLSYTMGWNETHGYAGNGWMLLYLSILFPGMIYLLLVMSV